MPNGSAKPHVTNTTPNVSTSTVKTTEASTGIKPDIMKRQVISSGKQNVLNNYRNYTYKWTLAALKKGYDRDPTLYRDSSLELVIIESGGKGTSGIVTPGDIETKKAEANKKYQAESTNRAATADSLKNAKKELDASIDRLSSTAGLVSSFNKESPGRFDMFIDQVEIYSLIGFGENNQTITQPNSIKFEIIEPYSVNGFIEALHVAGVAAGYASYLESNYVLKLEFLGYPDNDLLEFKPPEIVPDSTRYFPFRFLNVELEITERGTKYRCAGSPVNEKTFGEPDVLKKPISASGNTVGTVLKDLFNNLNNQVKQHDANSKTSASVNNNYNEYEIKFPTWDSKTGWDFNKENDIAKAEIVKILKEPAVYKFPDPAKEENQKKNNYNPRRSSGSPSKDKAAVEEKTKEPESVKLTPGAGQSKPQIQFAENARLTTVISAIIRDSEYLKEILKDIDNKVDQFGYIDYFLVRAESIQKAEFDPATKKHYEKFTFIVSPYKIHYSKIPGFQSRPVPEEKMKVLSLREYNYIYTGKNVDVLNFKLNFNNLFFEAVPVNNGNTNQPNSKQGVAREGSSVVRNSGEGGTKQEISTKEVAVPQSKIDTSISSVIVGGASGNQRQDDVYSALAKNMHNAIVNSKGSMLSGDLEIIGDPYYLVTGGIGNYNPKPALGGPQSTIDGEANQIYGEVLVTINFRNPVDINSLENGGLYEFDNKRVPFSGVYSVQSITSTFQDGFFKQKLNVLRAPGQVLSEYDTSATKTAADNNKQQVLSNQFKIAPKPIDTPMPSTTVGSPAGSRPDTINLLTQLSRGLPSPGLPGMLSNFTAAVGGLGGSASSLLNQVSGAVSNGIGKLTAAANVFGGSIPGGVDQLASGIRLNASGLTNLAQNVLSPAALVNQVSNSLETSFPVTNAAVGLANNIVAKASAVVNSISVPGSGIGAGATVLINKEATSAASAVASADFVPDGATLNLAQSIPASTNVKSLTGIASNLGNDAMSAVATLGSAGSSLVNGIGDKVKSLSQGFPTDPTAMASKFGINASQLSGLSDNLKSKVLTQLSDVSKNIPADTNLSQSLSQGVVLDYVPSSKIANLPATSPYSIAPSPEVNQGDLQAIAEKGGPAALARAFGVKDISKISSDLLPASAKTDILSGVSSALNNPLTGLKTQFNTTDVTALGGKLLSAGSQLSSITGSLGQSLESKLSSVQSVVGPSINSGANLALSVTSKFGSSAASSSPLGKLINNNTDVG